MPPRMKFGAGGTAIRGNPLTPQRHSSPFDDVAVAANVLGIHPDLAHPWDLNPSRGSVKKAYEANPDGPDKKEAYEFLRQHAYEQQWGTSNTAYGSGVTPQKGAYLCTPRHRLSARRAHLTAPAQLKSFANKRPEQ